MARFLNGKRNTDADVESLFLDACFRKRGRLAAKKKRKRERERQKPDQTHGMSSVQEEVLCVYVCVCVCAGGRIQCVLMCVRGMGERERADLSVTCICAHGRWTSWGRRLQHMVITRVMTDGRGHGVKDEALLHACNQPAQSIIISEHEQCCLSSKMLRRLVVAPCVRDVRARKTRFFGSTFTRGKLIEFLCKSWGCLTGFGQADVLENYLTF